MYHIIFVCKYRRKVPSGIDSELKEVIKLISENSDFEILEMETDKDHIHLLVKSEPKISTLSIVRRLKQETTVKMWKEKGEDLSKFLPKRKDVME